MAQTLVKIEPAVSHWFLHSEPHPLDHPSRARVLAVVQLVPSNGSFIPYPIRLCLRLPLGARILRREAASSVGALLDHLGLCGTAGLRAPTRRRRGEAARRRSGGWVPAGGALFFFFSFLGGGAAFGWWSRGEWGGDKSFRGCFLGHTQVWMIHKQVLVLVGENMLKPLLCTQPPKSSPCAHV